LGEVGGKELIDEINVCLGRWRVIVATTMVMKGSIRELSGMALRVEMLKSQKLLRKWKLQPASLLAGVKALYSRGLTLSGS